MSIGLAGDHQTACPLSNQWGVRSTSTDHPLDMNTGQGLPSTAMQLSTYRPKNIPLKARITLPDFFPGFCCHFPCRPVESGSVTLLPIRFCQLPQCGASLQPNAAHISISYNFHPGVGLWPRTYNSISK